MSNPVYVKLTRPEGYDDVCDELVVEDASIHPAFLAEPVTDEIAHLRSALEQIASHYGSAEQCREIAAQALADGGDGEPRRVNTKLCWMPITPDETVLPDELKSALRKRCDGMVDVVMDTKDLPYLRELEKAGVKGVDVLIRVIRERGLVKVYEE